MSYDKLIELPKLTFDRQRVRQGGDALADYMQQLVEELEERLRDVNRYSNHFRGWTHANDFDKLDGGDHYAGSIQTEAAALLAWTNPQSAFTQETTPISNTQTAEQTLVFTATGQTLLIFWGAEIGYTAAPTGVRLRLYRDAILLVELGSALTVSGYKSTLSSAYVEAPAAGDVTYTLQAFTAAPGDQATLSNRYIAAVECKR